LRIFRWTPPVEYLFDFAQISWTSSLWFYFLTSKKASFATIS
jgi:hypothetical protein